MASRRLHGRKHFLDKDREFQLWSKPRDKHRIAGIFLVLPQRSANVYAPSEHEASARVTWLLCFRTAAVWLK